MNHHGLANAPRPHQDDGAPNRKGLDQRQEEIEVRSGLITPMGVVDHGGFPPGILEANPPNDVRRRNCLHLDA